MELDFRSIRALASQARVNILRELLNDNATTDELSESTGIPADQLMLHLETLRNADLIDVETEEESLDESYQPTEKARAIVDGRERKVRFSLAAATLGTIMGVSLIGEQLLRARPDSVSGEGVTTDTLVEETAQGLFTDPLFASTGVILVLLAVMIGYFGVQLHRLGS